MSKRKILELLERANISDNGLLGELELERIADSVSHEMSSLNSNEEEEEGDDEGSTFTDNDSLSLPASLISNDKIGGDIIKEGDKVLSTRLLQGEKELALNNLKTEFELKFGFLEERVANLQHDKNVLNKILIKERQEHKITLNEMEAKYLAEMGNIKESLSRCESELPLLRNRLNVTKDMLVDLEISDTLYHKLKHQPIEDLSIKEYVAIQFHEVVYNNKKELDSTRRELETMRDALSNSHESSQQENRRAAHRVIAAETKAGDLEHTVEQLEATVSNLNIRLGAANAKVDELAAKGRAYDKVASEAERFESEALGLSSRLNTMSSELAATRDQRDDLLARERNLSQKIEILSTDKKYLSKESESGNERARAAETKVERLQAKIRDLKKTKEAYYEQLLISKDKNRTEYEDRLASEIHKIREASTKELEEIRINSRDMYERENRAIRESRDEAIQSLEREISKSAILQSHVDEMKLSQSVNISSHETALSDLRNELKLKIFELERVGLNYEEQQLSIRQAKIENEMLSEKLSVLKNEFSKLQSEFDGKVGELNAELSNYQNKVRAYEELEIEYDNAILRAGNLMDGGKDGGDKDELIIKSLGDTLDLGIPTLGRRRVKQSLMLAQRLLKSQKETATVRSLLEEEEKKSKKLKNDLDTEKKVSMCIDMPKGYLVERIRNLEKEVSELKFTIEHLQEKLEREEKEVDALTQSKAGLEAHVSTLLSQKQELIAMRVKISQLRKENEETKTSLVNIPIETHQTLTSSYHHKSTPNTVPTAEKENTEVNVAASSSITHSASSLLAGSYSPTHPTTEIFSLSAPTSSREKTPREAITPRDLTTPRKTPREEINANSSFVLHASDNSGAPLPAWYKKLRRS